MQQDDSIASEVRRKAPVPHFDRHLPTKSLGMEAAMAPAESEFKVEVKAGTTGPGKGAAIPLKRANEKENLFRFKSVVDGVAALETEFRGLRTRNNHLEQEAVQHRQEAVQHRQELAQLKEEARKAEAQHFAADNVMEGDLQQQIKLAKAAEAERHRLAEEVQRLQEVAALAQPQAEEVIVLRRKLAAARQCLKESTRLNYKYAKELNDRMAEEEEEEDE